MIQIWIGWLHLHGHDPWYTLSLKSEIIKKNSILYALILFAIRNEIMSFSLTRERLFFVINWISRVDLFSNVNIWSKKHSLWCCQFLLISSQIHSARIANAIYFSQRQMQIKFIHSSYKWLKWKAASSKIILKAQFIKLNHFSPYIFIIWCDLTDCSHFNGKSHIIKCNFSSKHVTLLINLTSFPICC